MKTKIIKLGDGCNLTVTIIDRQGMPLKLATLKSLVISLVSYRSQNLSFVANSDNTLTIPLTYASNLPKTGMYNIRAKGELFDGQAFDYTEQIIEVKDLPESTETTFVTSLVLRDVHNIAEKELPGVNYKELGYEVFSPFKAYAKDSVVLFGDTLYKFTSAKAAGIWDASKVETTSVAVGAGANYSNLLNKPKINGNTVEGNKTGENLGLVDRTSADYKAIKEAFEFTPQPSKNLYDYNTVGVVEGLINTTGIFLTPPTLVGYATGLIPIQPNHYYYLSNRANNSAKSVRCLASDKTTYMKVLAVNGEEYSTYAFPNIDATDTAANGQFKTPANAAYIQINLTPIATETLGDYYKIMLEDVGNAYDPNFVPSAYEPYNPSGEQTAKLKDENLQYPVEELREQLCTIKVLCVGSSITQDEMSYLPAVLKSIAPSVQLTIGLAYIGGAPLAQHTAYLTDETIEYEGYRYYIDNGVYKKMQLSNEEVTTYSGYTLYKSVNGAAWQNAGNKTIEQVIANERWDIITYQGSAKEAADNWDEAYAPFVYKIENAIYANLTHNAKLGWILIHSGYCSSDAAYVEKWRGIAANTIKVMKQTGVSILFPSGTAVQNLRTIQALRELGDGAHANLLADNVHLQEGIGCLTAAYANAITILNAMGLDYKSVIGDQTRPDAEWVTEQNIPGPNLGPEETGSGVIGITDANCLLAQIAAVNAVKYPYSVISPSVSSPYNERVVAEVGDDKYEVIKAMLEGVLYAFENGLPSLRVEELTIARKLDAYIKEGNALTSRAGAPTILPQYNGQEYFDTTNKVWYKASYTGTEPTASAWKQITN